MKQEGLQTDLNNRKRLQQTNKMSKRKTLKIAKETLQNHEKQQG